MNDIKENEILLGQTVIYSEKFTTRVFTAEVVGFTKQMVKLKSENGNFMRKIPNNLLIIR